MKLIDLAYFISRAHEALTGKPHGMPMHELAELLATDADAVDACYQRLQVWGRDDCRDSHGLGYHRHRRYGPTVVYRLCEPFDPPPAKPAVAGRWKKQRHVCP
jgi:hypothetical protein